MPVRPLSLWRRFRFHSGLLATVVLNLNGLGVQYRSVCAPGFNCHGCVWASAACPIGVVTFGAAVRALPVLPLVTMLGIGALVGRAACAFVCPFGLLQDLLYRLPGRKLALPRWSRYGKYLALGLLVFVFPYLLGFAPSGYLMLHPAKLDKAPEGSIDVTLTVENLGEKPVTDPVFTLAYRDKATGAEVERVAETAPGVVVAPGQALTLAPYRIPNRLSAADLVISSPQSVPLQTPRYKLYYCKLCPAGTLTASLPASLAGAGRGASGMWERNGLRLGILAAFLVLMVLTSRAFCRTFCPLGAVYGLFYRLAVTRVEVDEAGCTHCRNCDRVCPVDLDVVREAGGPECIACGDCVQACPQAVIRRTVGLATARVSRPVVSGANG